MRIFDVTNKARIGYWCAAPDEETAKQIALQSGHARKIENLQARDVTEHFVDRKGISEILAGNKTGRVLGYGTSLSFEELASGMQAPPVEWKIVERIAKEASGE